MIKFLLSLLFISLVATLQAQDVKPKDSLNDYKALEENLLLNQQRIGQIDLLLAERKQGRIGGCILAVGILGYTSYDLIKNNQDLSKKRKTWDWIGVSFSSGALLGFFLELDENKRLRRERQFLESFCFQQQIKIDSLKELEKELEPTNWEKAKSVNTLLSYKNYFKQYPDGTYRKEARVLIDELLWKHADSINTLEGYDEYMNTCLEDTHRKDARARYTLLKRIKNRVDEAEDILVGGSWEYKCGSNTFYFTFRQQGEMKIEQVSNGMSTVLPFQGYDVESLEPGKWRVNVESSDRPFKDDSGCLLTFRMTLSSSSYTDLYGCNINGKKFMYRDVTCERVYRNYSLTNPFINKH